MNESQYYRNVYVEIREERAPIIIAFIAFLIC